MLYSTSKQKISKSRTPHNCTKKVLFCDDDDDLMTSVHKDVKEIKKEDDQIRKVFNEYFPEKTIKPLQYNIVKSIIDGNDTIVILPTGYGKSMCYQLPFLINQDKVVIVISPLISLMEDQKTKLEKLNIPVACFHSNVAKRKKQEIKTELLENLIMVDSDDPFDDDNKSDTSKELSKTGGMILYLTPEYIINCENWIKKIASNNKLTLVAIDEAHCISTWGHDFRPDYQGLYRIKEWIKDFKVPILALTATATEKVREDIKTFLQLEKFKIFTTSFDRPNLCIEVFKKPKDFTEIFPILDKYTDDFSIVYCKTREIAENICTILKNNNYNTDVYHAGLSAKQRQVIQDKFSNKELNIIVATIAFGMGIDQDIHLVIHWGCPSDMESYYQEIGRAGRDGIDSNCYMYYDKDDFRISRYFLRSIMDTTYRRFRDEQISKMERYCLLPTCRRKMILSHFGEKLPDGYMCQKCDNCHIHDEMNKNIMNNLMYPIYIVVKTIFLVKCKMGVSKLCMILRGSKSKLITIFNKCKTFGMLKNLSDDQIKNIVNILIINCYLREKTIYSGYGTVLETTSKLVVWYSKICHESNNQLSFDDLNPILSSDNNKLSLNIPSGYTNLADIKFKTTLDTMINEFKDELIL